MRKLFEHYPILAAEWHPTKNIVGLLEKISTGSKKKVWWLCSKGHEYEARPDGRTAYGYGCPYCGRKKKGLLSETHPNLVLEWHSKNNLKPHEVTGGSHEKVWWLGKCGHEWEALIHNRAKAVKPSSCPYCCNKLVDETNSLLSLFPKLANEWHPIKNGDLKPSDVNHRTYKKVWWLGKCGHEWQTLVRTRTRDTRPAGCPVCKDSKGEIKIERVLQELGLEYQKQVRFSSCRDKKPLPFDFMVEDELLIEFQGIQHYEPTDFGGNPIEVFNGIQRRDKIKVSWCEANNRKLLIIPYWDIDNIPEILKKEGVLSHAELRKTTKTSGT